MKPESFCRKGWNRTSGQDAAMLIKGNRESGQRRRGKTSCKLIALAIQRYAADHVAETTVSVVSLPNDEMKGRIISREGEETS